MKQAFVNFKEMYFSLWTLGPRKAFQKYRWKLVGGIFMYYLIRDTFLYILVPAFGFYYLTGS